MFICGQVLYRNRTSLPLGAAESLKSQHLVQRHPLCSTISMLKNFFKLAGRNLRRHGTYSLLNILGLSMGIACILMLSLHVKEELSYDKAFPKHDRIYRVCTTDWAKSSPPLAREMSNYFPQISSYARFAEMGDNVISTTQGNKAI